MSARRGFFLRSLPFSLEPNAVSSSSFFRGHACLARAIGAFPVSGIRLSFLIHASIRSPRQTSLARPARGIVPEPSIFPCVGRIAFPHILSWSCPPGEGNRSLPCFGNTSFFPYTCQHSQSPPNQSRTPGERDSSRTVHLSLCRQDCLPAHIPMVTPAWRGLCSLYQVFAAHRAAMATVNECSGRGNLFPNRPCIYYTIFAEK